MPQIDFTGVKEGFEIIPEGKYPATLEKWEYFPTAKSSGEPYVALTFHIIEGEFEGRKLWRNYSLQKQSLWAIKRTAVRLGSDPDMLNGPLDLDDFLPDLVGAPCVVDVGIHPYNDEDRNDVKDVLSVTGVA